MTRRIQRLSGIAVLAGLCVHFGTSGANGQEPSTWQDNVEAALARVEAEQHDVSPSEPEASQAVLLGVRTNLLATLALYESNGKELPVHLAQFERRNPRPAREREAATPRERETDRPRDRQRERPERERAERDRPERERPERDRPAQRDRERERPARERDAAPSELAKPHPRIVAALGSQQDELKKLTARVERMERQLRQLQQRAPQRDSPQPQRESDRPRRPRDIEARGDEARVAQRERAMREARERMEREVNERRERAMAEMEVMRARNQEIEQQIAMLSEHKRELQIQREQTERVLERAQREMMEKSKKLHEVESKLVELKSQMARNSAEGRARELRLRIDQRRLEAERDARSRRETRKPSVPDDAI